MTLTANFPLLLALVFSFILAAIGALLGGILVYYGLKFFSQLAWWKLEHFRRYKLLIATYGKRINDAGMSFAVVGDLEDEETPGEDSIIPPFALLDFAVVLYNKSKTDSLSAFLDIVVEPHEDAET
jgi:hypothetical protein